MDASEKEPGLVPSEFIHPDTGSIPPSPELLDLADGAAGTSAAVSITPEEIKQGKKSSTPLQVSLRRLRRDKRALVSFSLIVLFVVIAIIGPPIYQHIGGVYQSQQNGAVPASIYHSASHEELIRQDEGPSALYWLGTDDLGRDMFARLMQGMLISLLVAIVVEIVDIVLGITVGVLAGYFGGWIDQFLARFTDVMFAFPGLLFAILLTGIIGPATDDTLSH